MKKNFFLSLLFVCSSLFSQKNEDNSALIDSIFTHYCNTLLEIPIEESLKIGKEMLSKSKTQADTAQSYSCMGYAYNYLKEKDSAHIYYHKSFEIAKDFKDPTIYINNVIHYSNVILFSNDNFEYFKLLYNALEKTEQIKKETKRNYYKSKLYFYIARLHSLNNDHVNSLSNYFKVIKYSTDKNRIIGYYGLGEGYFQLKDYDNSIKYFKISLEEFKKHPANDVSNEFEINILLGLGMNYYRQGSYADAKKVLYSVMSKQKPTVEVTNSVLYLYLARIEKEEKNYEKELYFLNLAEKYSTEDEINHHLESIFLDKTYHYINQKNTENALKYLTKYIATRDSLTKTEKLKIEKNIYAKHQLAESNKKIIENENEIQTVKKEKTIYFTFSLIIFILLVIILILYFLRNKSQKELLNNKEKLFDQEINLLVEKQKNEVINTKINTQKKERDRISKELHDDLAGQICAVKFNVESQNEYDPLLIKELNSIYNKVRNLSHALSESIEKPEFSELLLNFIEIIKKTGINISYRITDLEEIDHFDSYKLNSLYKVIQESFSNILKHAQANNVELEIYIENNLLHLNITDDGIGFQIDKTRNTIGLKSMKNRIEDLKGTLEITSQKNETTVQVTLPTPYLN